MGHKERGRASEVKEPRLLPLVPEVLYANSQGAPGRGEGGGMPRHVERWGRGIQSRGGGSIEEKA